MTYPSCEDRDRQNRALMGLDRDEHSRQVVEDHQKAAAAARGLLSMLSSGAGGTAAAPAREDVERVLGRPAVSLPAIDYSALAARNQAVTASPNVRGWANATGVDLSTVTGTGAGGRISLDDVRTAEQQRAALRPAAAATSSTDLVERRSLFIWSQLVLVNEYGSNPLVEDIAQTNLDKAAFVLASGDKPPTMFESGDRPVFTASGIPPAALAAVPWSARHVIARVASEDAAYLLNKFTPGPTSDRQVLASEALMMFETDDENQAYKSRVTAWWEAWQPDYNVVDANGFTIGWKKNDTRVWQP